MKVILKKDIKELGKVGDLVSVTSGYARNYLFPRSLALEATEKREKEWGHLKKMAEAQKKKALEGRKDVLGKLNGVTLSFKVAAGEGDKLFGSITNHDVSKELEKKGFEVDRRDIVLEPIKILGQHQATVKMGEGLQAELVILVERADS